MVNLKRETEMKLREYDKGVDDIVWMGECDVVGLNGRVYPGYRVSNRHMLNFFDVEYDNDWSADEIPLTIVVVGDDWWLERVETDGQVVWEFKTLPQPPKAIVKEGTI